MTAVVKQVIRVVEPQARAKGVRIIDRLPPVYYQVEADYDLICQAVQNLLTNAVKYTPPGGEVRINVSVDERRHVASVEVVDTGIGIPADELPKIFEKFYRVRANQKMASGTGLGLPLAKHIVEVVHGGTISVTSALPTTSLTETIATVNAVPVQNCQSDSAPARIKRPAAPGRQHSARRRLRPKRSDNPPTVGPKGSDTAAPTAVVAEMAEAEKPNSCIDSADPRFRTTADIATARLASRTR